MTFSADHASSRKKKKPHAFGAPRDPRMNVSAWPPGHFVASFLGTGILGGFQVAGEGRLSLLSTRRMDVTLVGVAGVVVSFGMAFRSIQSFRQYQTPVPHGYKVTTLVQSGIFGYSRNPLYLGMVGAVSSLGFVLNSWWGPLGGMYLFVVLQTWVIPQEETYLEENFGRDYTDYKNTVPRWICFI